MPSAQPLMQPVHRESSSLHDFAVEGIPRIHPLWLVRGLSNNVIGFTSAAFNIQGANMNYCMGRDGGWNALTEALWAIQSGSVDIACWWC